MVELALCRATASTEDGWRVRSRRGWNMAPLMPERACDYVRGRVPSFFSVSTLPTSAGFAGLRSPGYGTPAGPRCRAAPDYDDRGSHDRIELKNPWPSLPTKPPYVLEIDAPTVRKRQATWRARSTEQALDLSLHPIPFQGNPGKARVVFLMLNPGRKPTYSEPDPETDRRSDKPR
jgi:hypothetical protein